MNEDKREWTAAEKQLIRDLKDKPKKGWLQLAKLLDRTPDSIRMWYRNNVSNTTKEAGASRPVLDAPVVGLFDVETLPMEVYAWQMFDQSFSVEQVIHPSNLLAWAGKFLNAPDTYSDILTPIEAINRDDARITKSCWEWLRKCDIVVGHNLIDFDSKVIATMFLKHGLDPLKYIQVDTLKTARQHFRFDSNKLAFINKSLGIRDKMENDGFPLWRGCRMGDEKSLQDMAEYNRGDVLALEELYYTLRPYFHHLNVALYQELVEDGVCPVCGGKDMKEEGFYFTTAGKYISYRCQICRCLTRGKTNQKTAAERKRLLINS